MVSNSCLSWGGPAHKGSQRVRGVRVRGAVMEVSWQGLRRDREKEEVTYMYTHAHTHITITAERERGQWGRWARQRCGRRKER